MTSYLPCAGSPVSVSSVADTTGVNQGQLTASFTTGVLGTMPPIYEWYRATVATVIPGQLFTPAPCGIYLNLRKPVSFTYPVGGSEWDAAQPVLMRNGDELFFFWQLASSAVPVPYVTCFFRYDTDLPANQGYRG